MSEDDKHECTPPADEDGRVRFFTCPEDGRTWLREPGEPPQWREIQPENQ